MIRQLEPQAVRDEFDLFCRIALDDTLRAAVGAIPFPELGLETGALRCPADLRGRNVEIKAELFNPDGSVAEVLDLTMELDQFVRLRTFLDRFSLQQIRKMRETLCH